eukprot:SAG22_NODE_2483_length_2525_cov_5.067601_4_plen_91_part_00
MLPLSFSSKPVPFLAVPQQQDLFDALNAASADAGASPLMLQQANPHGAQRRLLYDEPILERARIVMIDKMARPEEVRSCKALPAFPLCFH